MLEYSIVLYYYYCIELLQLVTDTDTSILLDRVKVARAGEIFAPGARNQTRISSVVVVVV